MSIGIKYEHSTRIIHNCKICGEIPSVHKAFEDYLYKIECADCARGTGSWTNFDDALTKWDAINVDLVPPIRKTKKNAIDYFEKRILLLDRWLKRQPPILKSDPYLEERNAIMVALEELKKVRYTFYLQYDNRKE